MTEPSAESPDLDRPLPRHIALFLPSLRGGGAERVMVTLANGFAARGHRVDLVLARAEGAYLTEIAESVNVIDLNQGRVLGCLLPLMQYLRRERPAALLSAMTHANIVAILAHKLAGVTTQLVVSEHGAPSHNLAGSRQWTMRQLVRRLYPQADRIVCVSKGIEAEMARLFHLPPNRLCTIYNPLDVERVQTMMTESVTHPWLSNPKVPVVLAVGRLASQKDYPTLLKAFATLLEGRSAKLIVLGEGEKEQELKQVTKDLGITDHVAFVGFQANPFAWMRRSDLFILSSAWEGLPGALMEALVCGARVVSTDCPTGPAEILEGGRWGRLVPVGDPEALARAAGDALDDPTPRNVSMHVEKFRPSRALSLYEHALFTRSLTG